MGYRFCDPKPIDLTDMFPVLDVTNYEIKCWSIPCFYLDIEKPVDWHDPKMHDHIGWPRPDMPDHICQRPWELTPDILWEYIDMNKAKKIHLMSEYELAGAGDAYAVFKFDEVDAEGNAIDVSGIDVETYIRDPEDWIIDIIFKPQLPLFADKPKEFMFNLFYEREGELGVLTKDLVMRGKLVVFPC